MEKKKQNKYTDKQKKDGMEALKLGMSIAEAAEVAGVPYSAIYDWKKSGKLDGTVVIFSKTCPDCGEGPFTKAILYAQHRSAKHPSGVKRVRKAPPTVQPPVHIGPSHWRSGWPPERPPMPGRQEPILLSSKVTAFDDLGGLENWQVAEDAIVARVIKHFEDKPVPAGAIYDNQRTIDELVTKYLKEHPVKISTDDFMNMLRNLVSENTQTKEELARLRRSLGEWQQRAGRIMEQAQELAQKK
jgi:hypothetical protein